MSKENVLLKAAMTFLLLSPIFCNEGSHTDEDPEGISRWTDASHPNALPLSGDLSTI